tara:strand:- start:198 stop:527 length:330 start_codon:yes stop_codon:yes gene_type:complete
LEDSHIKKQWLPWILLAILASSNVHAECNKGSCQNGKGTYTWDNGDTYEGDWVDGYRAGKGKSTWANGDIEEGYYLDGVLVETLAERELAEKKNAKEKTNTIEFITLVY